MPTIHMLKSQTPGRYNCWCECGFDWNGLGIRYAKESYSPDVAIAEAVIHTRMNHSKKPCTIEFSVEFLKWIDDWWVDPAAHIAPTTQG